MTHKVKGALRLAALDAQALRLGLIPGLTLADARARIPELTVVELDRVADATLLERLADGCDRYTPLVALNGPDSLTLDITGCATLFGGEIALCRDLVARLSRIGFSSRVSLAGTPEAAHALARFSSFPVLKADEVGLAVKRLPVAALGVQPDIILALNRAGLKTIGHLAGQPTRPFATRFGKDLVRQLQRILGKEDGRITPRRPLPDCIVERPFAEPIARLQDIEATLVFLTGKAALALEGRGTGGRSFEASFFRTDGVVLRITVEASRPQRDPAIVLRLFRDRLEALADPLDPGFGFDLIRLAMPREEPFERYQSELDTRADGGEDVGALVDRLVARFGRERVLRFVAQDTHDPLRVVRFASAAEPATDTDWASSEADEPPLRPLHLFAPPQPIEALAEVPDGPPIRFRWRRVLHNIAHAEGPERIAPEWWRSGAKAPARDYYRVEDKAGHRFWLFREGFYLNPEQPPTWFLHGLFA